MNSDYQEPKQNKTKVQTFTNKPTEDQEENQFEY